MKRSLKVLIIGAALCTLTPNMALAADALGGLIGRLKDLATNQKVTDLVKNAFDKVGEGVKSVQDRAAAIETERREAHRKLRDNLSKKANDHTLQKWEREAAQKALLDEDERHRANMQRNDEISHDVKKMAANAVGKAVDYGIQESFAMAAHSRNLEAIALEAAQKRKAAVESTKEYIKAFTDPKNLTKFVLAAGGVFGLYFGLKHGITYIAEQYKKPELADSNKTSLKFGPLNFFKSLIYGTIQEDSALSDVILKPELAEEVNEITQSLKNIVMNGGYFDNLMLWGQPGTGKTMLAMRMARSCGLEYIYFTASNLETFSTEEASAQLVQLFRYAQNSPRKLMIIIDEAEALLGSRSRPDMTDKKRTLLNLVLGYTGTESRDYMVTVLTNRPEDIDEAFLSRCGMRIQIGAPDKTELRAILKSYVEKMLFNASNLKPEKPSFLSPKFWFGKTEKITPPTIEEGALSEEALDTLAEKLNGFVGRDISKLVFRIQGSAFTTEDHKITAALINKAVDRMLKERAAEKGGFIREGTNKGAPKAVAAA